MKLHLLNPYWINKQLEKEGGESDDTSVEECSDGQDAE